jgi:tetratricopeptide (TPR) repeat protein
VTSGEEEGVSENFDGFITPDGKVISIHDVDKMFAYLAKRHDDASEIARTLWAFADECAEEGHLGTAYNYWDKVLTLVEEPARRAHCLLSMGQVRELSGAYEAAAETYARAFEIEQEPDAVWYFLNNNLGYCLNQLGRHTEAVGYCRAAIRIDKRRHNAHKNLGVALQGTGKYPEAAKSYMRAVKACPEDERALGHLRDLVTTHPEVQCDEGVRRALKTRTARNPAKSITVQ